jgi:hypothetical protein
MRHAWVIAMMVAGCVAQPVPALDPLDPYGDKPQPEPWLAAADGDYLLRTHASIVGSAPRTALRKYVDAPGTTLVAHAGSIASTGLLAAVAPQLPGWFDEVLRENGVALLAQLGTAKLLQLLPHAVEIESELTITDDRVVHAALGMRVDPPTYETLVPVGGVDGEIVDATSTAVFWPTTSGGMFTLDTHELVLAVGDAWYQYLDQLQAAHGGLRGIGGQLTACPLVALGVAGRCGASCALSLSQLVDVCERGLDGIYAATRNELGLVRVHLTSGSAAMGDTDGDERADSLVGAWRVTAESPIDGGVVSFDGKRRR